MSKRHRSQESAPLPKAELRAQARGERHRINTELHTLAEAVTYGDVEPDDVEEPGASFKPEHHRDAERDIKKLQPRRFRHWKLKDWKRRTARRRAKAEAWRLAEET